MIRYKQKLCDLRLWYFMLGMLAIDEEEENGYRKKWEMHRLPIQKI